MNLSFRKCILWAILFFASLSLLIIYGLPSNKTSRMQEIVKWYVDNNHFMGAVLVAQDKQMLVNQGYGYSEVEWKAPNSETTKFRLGSISKQFTATAILLLEEQGKLNVNDLVKSHMPNTPASWDKITIFNLLTHTSGIPNYTAFSNFKEISVNAITPEKLIALFREKPLNFKPGEKWEYSNSGYEVLGFLIEKISGESYQHFIVNHIFKPLGMNDSGYDSNSEIIMRRASGYSFGPEGLRNADFINMSVPYAAGGIYSTTPDLLRWEQGLFGGKILSAKSLEKMITPFKSNYGFGLEIQKIDDHLSISHGGGVNGFITMMIHYPDNKLNVIVLSNNDSASGTQNMATKLAAVAQGKSAILLSERKEVTISPNILGKYVGTYKFTEFQFVLTLENSHLMAQIVTNQPQKGQNQPKSQLYPESETSFFTKTPESQIQFLKNKKGDISRMVFRPNDVDYIGVRVQ